MKKLRRCRWDKKIAGVCGGLGQYLQIDPTFVRIAAILLTIFTGFLPGIIIYLLFWILTPEGPAAYIQIPGKKLTKSRYDRKIAGVCGGLAEYMGISSTILRVITVLLFFITGFVLIIITYIIAALIIPEELSP